jgi:ribonuclease VapC
MFVDASAIVAIITREPEEDAFTEALIKAATPVTSGLAIFEATRAIARKKRSALAEAEQDVRDFLAASHITIVSISDAEAAAALDACARYGKGRGHAAQLNMGDCCAYAAAQNRWIPLLFKGGDFAHTDIAQAVSLQ